MGAAATALVARKLPDLYQSQAVILVVPQQIPDRYVRSTVTTPMDERLQAISQQILSRTRLERIIEEFGLYSTERRTVMMEDIVDRMRTEIKTAAVKGDAFRVSYQGSNARTVQRVTAALASLFIEESLRDRSVLAEGTSQFLEVQLADARRRLIEQEKKLEAYRMKFSGQLPTQVGANMQALSNVQQQIQATLDSINHDRDNQLLLQQQLGELQNGNVDTEPVAVTPAPNRRRRRRSGECRDWFDNAAAQGSPGVAGVSRAALQARLSGYPPREAPDSRSRTAPRCRSAGATGFGRVKRPDAWHVAQGTIAEQASEGHRDPAE